MVIPEESSEPKRCVIVVDSALPIGRAANAAAVIALTLGKRHPYLAGNDLIDASGSAHPGLIPVGIAVLGAQAEQLPRLRAKAISKGIDVVDFPSHGQDTNDYDDFGSRVAQVTTEDLSYVGVGMYGPKKAVSKAIGSFPLLR